MPFKATVYRVLIASPSDLKTERKAIPKIFHDWNVAHAADEGAVLLPVMWETAATPRMGDRGQEILNEQFVRGADFVVGVFWTRVGSPTGKEESGTIEEIKEILDQQKPVMLYFSERAIAPSSIDAEQYQSLTTFKTWCQQNGIYATYQSPAQLKSFLDTHLTRTVRELRRVHDSQSADDAGRIERLERATMQNTRSEYARELGGERLLDSAFIKKDMTRKACLSLTDIGGFSALVGSISIPFSLRNEGQYAAYDVTVSVDQDDQTIMSESRPRTIKENGGVYTFELNILRPQQHDPPEEHFWTFTVRAKFRDGLGADQATFVFTFGGKDPNFIAEEDVTKAELSRLCRFVRPR